MACGGALLVVLRRRAVQALGRRVGRALSLGGVDVDPRRRPHDRAHAGAPHAPDEALGVWELVRVEAPRVVLRLPRRVEHDRVERDRVAQVSVKVVEDVALVLVHVAALPEPVPPLGKHRRHPREPEVVAQACGGRRVEDEVQSERSGRGANRGRDRIGEPQLDPGTVGLEPQRPAMARQQPRHRGVVALRYSPDIEQLGRAVGARVAAIRPELEDPPALIEPLAVAGTEAGQPLVGIGRPARAEPERVVPCRELDHDPIALRKRDLDRARPSARCARLDPQLLRPGVLARQLVERLGILALLFREHALRERDQPIVPGAGLGPHPEVANHAPIAPPYVEPERLREQLHPQGATGKRQRHGASRDRGEHCAQPPIAGRSPGCDLVNP